MHRGARFLLVCLVAGYCAAPVWSQTFKNPAFITTASDPSYVVTADLNHDGKADLVYIDGGGSALHILLGRGNGTFVKGQDFSLIDSTGPTPIAIADVTNDGIPDIIVAGSEFTDVDGEAGTIPQVTVFVGNGDGTFQAPIVSTLQPLNIDLFSVLESISVGDIDGDGYQDLALTDEQNGLIYLVTGNGTGKFSLAGKLAEPDVTNAYLADVNGDGKLDIVATENLGATAFVFLGNGNATFQAEVTYNIGAPVYKIFFADFDGDGRPDLVGDTIAGALAFMKGMPDGTFASPITVSNPSGGTVAVIRDLNGDGIPDVLSFTPTGVSIDLGPGNLKLGSPTTYVAGGSSMNQLAIADFNGDGNQDFAMGVDGGISLLLSKSDDTFTSADYYDTGHSVGAVAVADFNGDGIPDIAVAETAPIPELLFGKGDGTFMLNLAANSSYGTQGASTGMTVGDFNGDGKPDIVLTTLDEGQIAGAASVVFGTDTGLGNTNFSAPLSVTNGSATVADVNNDGRSDLVSVCGDFINTQLGQASDAFAEVDTQLRGALEPGCITRTVPIAIGDFNNDHKLDVIVGGADGLETWLGNGGGTFDYSGFFGSGVFDGQDAQVADLDGDGNQDIVLLANPNVSDPAGPVEIFYGNGDGTFQPPQPLVTSHRYTQVVIADVNHDGKPDLIFNDGSGISVLLNLGGRKFGPEQHYVAGQSLSYIAVADLNGDGFPDIVAANTSGTTVTVLLNEPTTPPVEGAASQGVISVTSEPSVGPQPFTVTLTMPAAGNDAPVPTGSVDFSANGGYLGTAPLIAGVANYTVNSQFSPGTVTVAANYGGDSTYESEIFSVLHLVQTPTYATQTALTASPASVFTSQTVHLTATVTGPPLPPSGIVTFLDAGNSIGSEVIDANGNAFLDTALLTAGTHLLTAQYEGYTNECCGTDITVVSQIFAPSASPNVTEKVNVSSTTTIVSATSSSPTAGAVVTFTATVSSGAGVPFGGVTFYDGGVPLGTSALESNGSASFSTASLSVGAQTITAAYYANATFAGSTSSPLSISVNAAPADVVPTFISLSPQGSANGPSPALVAEASASGGAPSGTIIFIADGQILGTAATDGSGAVTMPISALGSGIHDLTASFAGNAQFAPSASPALLEEWPATGPGFSLTPDAGSALVTAPNPTPIRFDITPIAGFQGQIQFSCGAGLPAGYACEFSPASLNGGGTTFLVIQNSSRQAETLDGTRPWYGTALGFVCLLLFTGVKRRRGPYLIALLGLLCFGTILGCGRSANPANDTQQMLVLPIEARSGTGATMIVHSTQITVELHGLNEGQ